MPRPRAPKRQYLARDDRRAALLDAAAALVETQGWAALTMISLAESAGVSRQLVYQHFASIDELMADTMAHLLRDAYLRIRDTIARNPENLAELLHMAENLTFDLPPARARALWQIMAGHYSTDDATSRMSRRLRHLLTNMWAPAVKRTFDLDERRGRTLIWMLIMGFWGAMQHVDDGEITRDEAIALSTWMISRLAGGSAAASARKPRK